MPRDAPVRSSVFFGDAMHRFYGAVEIRRDETKGVTCPQHRTTKLLHFGVIASWVAASNATRPPRNDTRKKRALFYNFISNRKAAERSVRPFEIDKRRNPSEKEVASVTTSVGAIFESDKRTLVRESMRYSA
jgi:hypothetical protein